MASDPYRTTEPDTCSHCGCDATCTREDGERYCDRCLPPVMLITVHELAAERERAAALEVALRALVEALPRCEYSRCESLATHDDQNGEWVCVPCAMKEDAHGMRQGVGKELPWADAARAAQALLGAGEGA